MHTQYSISIITIKKKSLPFGGLANIDVRLAEYMSPIT